MNIRKPRRPGQGWECRVEVNGTKLSKTFKSRANAVAWGRRTAGDLEAGTAGRAQVKTVDECFKRFILDSPDLVPRTLDLYEDNWEHHILPAFGNRLAGGVKRGDVESWRAKLTTKGLAASTVTRILNLLRAVFSHAVRCEILPANPCTGVEPPSKKDVRDVRMFTDEEVSVFFAATDDSPRLSALVRLGLATGMRIGELLAFSWEWIDTKRQKIRIPASLEAGFLPKGKTVRELDILADTAAVLKAWRPHTSGEGRLFVGVNKNRWAEDIRRRSGAVVAARRGIDLDELTREKRRELVARLALPFHWHGLRHTCASRMLLDGVPARVVQQWMGWASIRMVDRYSHLLPDQYSAVRSRFPLGIGWGQSPEAPRKAASGADRRGDE